MFSLLWLLPALPLLGFLMLSLMGKYRSEVWSAWVGAGSTGLAALIAVGIAAAFLSTPPEGDFFQQTLWQWFEVAGLSPAIGLHLDALSLVFVLVITVVGFFIHLYSVEFMRGEEGYRRFFAYMNLFVASMLVLVLADNLLLLYLGWEGVGLCSYLLIGFWYKNPDNGYAARKAFIMTRVGDTALALGLFLLFSSFQSLNIETISLAAGGIWETGSETARLAAFLLLLGAAGKSAQIPLQTWLPDAMAGPSPVSALIHAATMVTAGVYLVARMYAIFELAPSVMLLLAACGAVTLLIAGFSALTQRDIKRVLAYSTISQVGYMFLALGVGAWSAGVFHFFTHAFFKALLFLGAGVVIHAMRGEHDMFKMGGLRRSMPLTFWTFLAGAAALAALPLVTAGFYSKDLILWYSFASTRSSIWLWAAAWVGAFLTAAYTFRMVFATFFGEQKKRPVYKPGTIIAAPLIVLAVFSVIAGFLEVPHTLGSVHVFSDWLTTVLPEVNTAQELPVSEGALQLISGVTVLAGIGMAWLFYCRQPQWSERAATSFSVVHRFWLAGWGFDWLYDRLLVRPFSWLARVNRNDFIDSFYNGIAWTGAGLHHLLSRTQSGRLRWYAFGIALGAVIILTLIALS